MEIFEFPNDAIAADLLNMPNERKDRVATLIETALVQSMKSDLRAQMRAALQKMATDKRQQDSRQIRERLVRQSVWNEASAVLFFVPLPDEPDLLPLLAEALAAGKTVALPRYVPDTGSYAACRIEQYPQDCISGKFGIPEPSPACPIFPPNRLDLSLVPGLGFDLSGHRLGRGKGYYDRILKEVTGIRCGVAFDEQLIDQIPTEPHDIALNCILTPTQWMEFPAAR